MPELAEVEYYRKQWDPGLGKKIVAVKIHAEKRLFREVDTRALVKLLTGATLKASLAHGKQMLFQFSTACLGVHLGMTGKLFAEKLPYAPDKHDHLVLETNRHALVFRDPRLFGRVRFDPGKELPAWWTALPPQVLDDDFNQDALAAFLNRRKKAPLKAVLLMQERFPGIGNWMADEILWRAAIHPAQPAGSLSARQTTCLYKEMKQVCRDAMEVIGTDWGDPPDSWLFNHRWQNGGLCPKTGKPLIREEIGGRTTCYSPTRQRR